MSNVTNIMILGSDSDDLDPKLKEITDALGYPPFCLQSGDEVGGNKFIEASVWVGAFNYLDSESFIKGLMAISNSLDRFDREWGTGLGYGATC